MNKFIVLTTIRCVVRAGSQGEAEEMVEDAECAAAMALAAMGGVVEVDSVRSHATIQG